MRQRYFRFYPDRRHYVRAFYPDCICPSTYDINFEELYEKGVRGLIFDIDNTLVPHGAPADKRAKALFKRLSDLGFACCLLSNNGRHRVEMFNKDIHVHYIYKGGEAFRG